MEDVIKRIQEYSLEEIMGVRFGRYSKYIIQDRAIPDVRDGLKPVQRRILYAMYKNGNTYDKKTVKSALTVGDVIGKYHPHGDISVYDAMVRMSQSWKQREPYIIFQGNNGSIDGDPQAAYRYTEAKLSKISNEMLRDLNKDSVVFAPTFDDSRLEPTVLPARFPALLVNGTTGISAGYATNIPPHNLGEVIDATIKRIENPNCHLDTIMDIVKGPDFPTGGTVEGINGIREAYETGKGKIIVKCKYEFVKNKNKDQIVITEIPYDVTITAIVKKIEEIRIDKKIEGIQEARNESGKEGLRIVIDLKSGADKNFILNYLLKNTDLQVSYNFNMVAVVNRRPKQLGILPILDAYIAHQQDVITRRTKFDLAYAKKEYHITEGLVKALSILDEVIRVIRSSKNKSDAEANLVKEFAFSEEQAKAIVTLQLYRLTNTDVTELLSRLENLKKVIEFLTEILSDKSKLDKVLKDELKAIKKEFANPRRTVIVDEITEIKLDVKEMIPKENTIVVVTNEGYIKRVNLKSYASASGEETTMKPGDFVTGLYQLTTLDTILVFTNLGRYIYLPVHTIAETKWKELGKHLNNYVTLSTEETIIGSVVLNPQQEIVFFTKNGLTKRSSMQDFVVSRYSKAMAAIKLKDDDELINVNIACPNTLFVSKLGNYLLIDTSEIPLVGAKASGVKGINLKDDQLAKGLCFTDKEYITVFTNNKTAKRIKVGELTRLTRAKKGSTLIKKVKTNSYYITNALAVNSKETISIKSDSEIKEIKVVDIPIMDLASTGSQISKYPIDNSFKTVELFNFLQKDNQGENPSLIEEPTNNDIQMTANVEELTIDDFIDEFKI